MIFRLRYIVCIRFGIYNHYFVDNKFICLKIFRLSNGITYISLLLPKKAVIRIKNRNNRLLYMENYTFRLTVFIPQHAYQKFQRTVQDMFP